MHAYSKKYISHITILRFEEASTNLASWQAKGEETQAPIQMFILDVYKIMKMYHRLK